MVATPRDRLLRAAAALLPRRGLAGLTVEDLLQKAGVSRRTFYLHFANLEEVVDTLFEVAIESVMTAVRTAAAAAPSDPSGRLEASLSAYLDLQRRFGPLAALLQSEAIAPMSRLAARREQLLDWMSERIRSGALEAGRAPLEPLLVRAALLAVEGICIEVHRSKAPKDARFAAARSAALTLLQRVFELDEPRRRTAPPPAARPRPRPPR